VSRIPTIQIKRLLQKSKKVVIKVQKLSEKLFHSHESFMYPYAKKAMLIISYVMNFVECVIINIDQLESRDRTSVRRIAAQNNKGSGCFL